MMTNTSLMKHQGCYSACKLHGNRAVPIHLVLFDDNPRANLRYKRKLNNIIGGQGHHTSLMNEMLI